MEDLSKEQIKKIKKLIEKDNFKKLKKYISSEEIPLDAIVTKKGEKMLHLAAKEGSPYCLEYLLDKGAKPNLVDKKGNTPLHRALRYVIEDYSKEDEKSLVNTLLTYSSKILDNPNFDGVTLRHLLLELEKIKSKKTDKYISPFSSSGTVVIEDDRTSDDEWRDKLAEEGCYEYEASFGKFEQFTSHQEPSSETFDHWADRIYKEFYSKRYKPKSTVKKEDERKKPKSLKPEIDLNEAKRNYEKLKEKKKLDSQRILCDNLFKSSSSIQFKNMPFKDMKAETILEILLGDIEGEASSVKKKIREELLKWHPDKFKQKNGDRIDEGEMDRVMNHVKHVSQVLINYGK